MNWTCDGAEGPRNFARFVDEELNILTAEDNADDVFLLQQAFRKAVVKHRLKAVCDGAEAVAYLKGEGAYSDRALYPFPDVLLLDLNMPRMNGFEVLKWLRQDSHNSGLVVHVLTASARQADIETAYDLHANSFVVKPTRLDDLVAFVAALNQWHRFTSFPHKPGAHGNAAPRPERGQMAAV